MENSQCRVDGAGTTVAESQTTYTLTVDLTYKPAFAGPKVIYAASQTTRGENSGWQATGTWRVTSAGGGGGGTLSVYPENGATNVAYNTRVILSLPAPVNPATVTDSTVRVLRNGSPVNVQRTVSADGLHISMRATSGIFPQSSEYAVVALSLLDTSGAALPTFQSVFQTGTRYDSSGFFWRRSLREDFPTSHTIDLELSGKVDPATFADGAFVLVHSVSGQEEPLACTLAPDFESLECRPSKPLHVGTQYSIRGETVYSVHGSRFSGGSLTTGFDTRDATPPSVVRIVPADGAINVAHPDPQIFFTEPVAHTWPAPDIQVTQNGAPVDVVFEPAYLGPNGLRIRCANYGDAWQPDSTYVITVNNAFDRANLPLSNGGFSSTFRTGPAGGSSPHLSASLRPGGYLRPLNTWNYVHFSHPVEPSTITSETVRIEGPAGPVEIARLLESPKTLRLTPLAPLSPNTTYNLYVGPWVTDLNGNAFHETGHFTTGDEIDTTPPEVLGIYPPDGATGVPYSEPFRISVSETVMAPGLGNVRLERVGGGSVPVYSYGTLGGGISELNHAPLELGQRYRLVLEGWVDLAGNPLPPLAATFETASEALPEDNTRPTLLSATPASGATDVSLTPTITLHFSKPLNPTTIPYALLATSGVRPPIDVVALDFPTIQITPLEPLLPGRTYYVGLSSLQDWAGNRATGSYSITTVDGPSDTTPPALLSVAPSDGSVVTVSDSSSLPIELVFSEPVDYVQLRNQIFILLDGRQMSASLATKGDGYRYSTSLYTGGYNDLGPDTEVSIVIGADVEDLYGNKLGREHRQRFLLRVPEQEPSTSYPRLIEVRPSRSGWSISPEAPVTLISSVQLPAEGLEEELLVSENGALAPGTITTRAEGQVVEFHPRAPFAPGALVQVFLTEQLEDAEGRKLPLSPLDSPHPFYVTGAERPFTISGVSFPYTFRNDLPSNAKLRVRLSGPALPSSVNASAVTLRSLNAPVPATVQLIGQGDLIELRPAANLPAGSYWLEVKTDVMSAGGEALASQGHFSFNALATADTQAPAVVAVSPPNGAVDAPLSARLCVGFSEPVDQISSYKEDLQLLAMGRSWPMDSATFADERSVCFTPVEALQPDTAYSVSFAGERDISGNVTGTASWSFRSGQRVDVQPPAAVPELNQLTDLPPASGLRRDATLGRTGRPDFVREHESAGPRRLPGDPDAGRLELRRRR